MWEDDLTGWKGASLILTSRHKLGTANTFPSAHSIVSQWPWMAHTEVLKLITAVLSQLLNRETKLRDNSLTALISPQERHCSEIFALYTALPHTFLSQAVCCLIKQLPASYLNACQTPPSAKLPLVSRIQEVPVPFVLPDHPPPYVWSQYLIENWILVVACDDNEPFMSQFEKAFETPVFISNYR